MASDADDRDSLSGEDVSDLWKVSLIHYLDHICKLVINSNLEKQNLKISRFWYQIFFEIYVSKLSLYETQWRGRMVPLKKYS